jgi:hypothetical protein
MVNRVFPTGSCWCGCGEATEQTSFFMPGHDKRAEARVVKEVYGGVAEFLAAHGYGPEGRDPAAYTSREDMDKVGIELLEKWAKESRGEAHVTLEVIKPDDRTRVRLDGFLIEYNIPERAFRFKACNEHCKWHAVRGHDLTVPLPDIAWVYLDQRDRRPRSPLPVVRLRGTIVSKPRPRFVPLA